MFVIREIIYAHPVYRYKEEYENWDISASTFRGGHNTHKINPPPKDVGYIYNIYKIHIIYIYYTQNIHYIKAIPLQAWTGPEGSRRLSLPDFKTFGTGIWQGCQPYLPAAFTPPPRNIPGTHLC
jgi:hypothetical protein